MINKKKKKKTLNDSVCNIAFRQHLVYLKRQHRKAMIHGKHTLCTFKFIHSYHEQTNQMFWCETLRRFLFSMESEQKQAISL